MRSGLYVNLSRMDSDSERLSAIGLLGHIVSRCSYRGMSRCENCQRALEHALFEGFLGLRGLIA